MLLQISSFVKTFASYDGQKSKCGQTCFESRKTSTALGNMWSQNDEIDFSRQITAGFPSQAFAQF